MLKVINPGILTTIQDQEEKTIVHSVCPYQVSWTITPRIVPIIY